MSTYPKNLYESVQRIAIIQVVKYCGGNQSKAAEILGISRGRVRRYTAMIQSPLEPQEREVLDCVASGIRVWSV